MDTPARDDEAGRLEALRRYRILDAEPGDTFEDLATLAAHVCAAPIAAVELIGERRGWLKAGVGFPVADVRRDLSFGEHVIRGRKLLSVRDTWNDHRFVDNPLVTGEPNARAFAGAPLITPDGHAIGALWVMDRIPRSLSPDQAAGLMALSRQAMGQMELGRHLAELRRSVALREKAELSLRQNDLRLHMVVDQMPAVLWSTDRDLRFTSSMGAGLAALELSPGELVGTRLQDYHGTEDQETGPIAAHVRALHGEATAYEHNWKGRRFESHVMPLREGEGRITGVLGLALDITERKRVEEELERAWQRESESSEHLRALDELKNLQLHAVSHDLRGPITAILGSALVLETDAELRPEQRRDLVHGITAAGRKLHRLVNNLLDLDRLERGLVGPDRKATDVGALVERVVAELEIDRHPIEVAAEGFEALVDPVHVERIVENLVLNAVRHTPPNTPIWVRVEPAGPGVAITVEDAGPGVPEELRCTIFEPFRQGGGGVDHPGVGIGLSLVARFADLHEGWARVEERPGGGASFRVFLGGGSDGEPVRDLPAGAATSGSPAP